jgi:alpha-beta hydrolase superfamily lysophospholipase
MTHRTFEWNTEDKKVLFAQSWEPEKQSKKTILLVHGLGENSGRYAHWAKLFTEKGFNFIGFDHRGHGKSSGKRGHARSLEDFLKDIDLAIHNTRELYRNTKLVLYGHSMGGNLSLNYIIKKNHPVDALIITSPWLKLVNEPGSLLLSMVSILSKIMPGIRIANGLSADDLSHDTEVGKKYTNDPLNHDKISFRMFDILYHSGYHALRNVYKINYPFLLMHGTQDNITSAKASENYVMNTSSRTHLKLWEGLYHELHNEPEYKEIFQYILDWLSRYDL